jgi:hypothetical protein
MKLAPAAILKQNPIFEMGSSHSKFKLIFMLPILFNERRFTMVRPTQWVGVAFRMREVTLISIFCERRI